jgi:CRP-like cAMP-binding protein
MAKADYLEHLRGVPLFSACSTRDLEKIAKASDELTLPAGHTLVEQDAIGHEAFVIVEGSAEVMRNGTKVTELGPGDHVGELALIDGGARTATVITTTDVAVLVLGQREFRGLLDEIPGLAHKVMAQLAARIRELDNKLYP